MNTRLQALAKRVDDLGETITMFKDPVDGSTVAALGWEELERILNKLTGTTLEGATNEPAEGTQIANAGEFAAKWNTGSVEDRERITAMLTKAVEDSMRCFIEDHEGLKAQFDVLSNRLDKVRNYADDRKAHARSQNNTLSSWRVWSDLYSILGIQVRNGWEVVYAHQDCPACEGAAEEAITLCDEQGKDEGFCIGIAVGGGVSPTEHAASVKRV